MILSKEKIKIVLISESMGGGLRKHVVQLINSLDKGKFELYFIHGTKNLDEAFIKEYKELSKICTMIKCSTFEREINFFKDFKTYKFISCRLKEIKPDVVHCHSSKAGAIGRIAAKRQGVKKIFYTPHAYSFMAPEFSFSKKKLFVKIEKWLTKNATSEVFCVSNSEKLEALKSEVGDPEKFKVIYNGLPEIDLPSKRDVREALALPEQAFIIGNNSRLTDQKDPFLFIEIAKKVVLKYPSVLFVWAGDGPLELIIKKKIDEYNLNNNVILLGFRSDSEKIVVAYDLFLLTSQYEGLPYAPIEALRAKVPVVATSVPGNTEVVDKPLNGQLINKENINEIVDIIENRINGNYKDTPETVEISFKNKFSIEKMIVSIEQKYLS